MKVYKYEFQIENDGKFNLDLPRYYKILTVGVQGPNPCMWVLLDPEEKTFKTGFSIYGTGHEIKLHLPDYAGTFFQGPYVWHVFKDVNTTNR